MQISIRKLDSFFIVYLLVGRQLIDIAPSIIGLPNRAFLWTSMGVGFIWALLIVLRGALRNTSVFRFDRFFLVFLLMYLFQMTHDLYFQQVATQSFPNKYTYFLYGVGICFVPAFAIKFLDCLDFRLIFKWTYRLLFLLLSLSLVYNTVLGLGTTSIRSEGSESMGPLTYGHFGVTFALMSFYLINIKNGILKKILYTLFFCFGLIILYIASSRSPLAALLVCSVFFLFSNKNLTRGAAIFIAVTGLIVAFWDKILNVLFYFKGSLVMRVTRLIEKGDSTGRDVIYRDGWNQFLESPLFGNSFLIENGLFIGYYPHNLILEGLMATGILGTICLLIWMFKTINYSRKLIVDMHYANWVGLLFVQYLIFGMVSKSLYTNNYLWYFAFLTWNAYYMSKRQIKNLIS